MPRLSPPRARRVTVEEPTPGEATLPGEDVVIELTGDDLDLIIVDEPNEPETVTPEPETPAEPTPEDALANALAAQQRAEEIARTAGRERDEAVRRANERQGELERERGDREEAQYNSVLTSLAAEQAMLEKAEADYASAFQSGDALGTAKAQTIMARAAARIDRLEDNKATIDQQRATAPKTPERRETPTPVTKSIDDQISQMGVPENAKAWLRTHPEIVRDKMDALGDVHRYVVNVKGIQQFTQPYFDALETELGLKKPPAAEPAPAAQPQRRSMPVTAPVSRDVPTSSGQRQTSSQVTLSAEEVRIAHSSFTDPTGKMTNADKERQYALNKMKLNKMRANGQYPSREQA